MSFDPLAQLTIQELDAVSRRIKTDVSYAIAAGTQDRWRGLAGVAHVLALRTNPAAKFSDFMAMRPAELSAALGYDDADEDADGMPDQLTIDDDVDADDVADALEDSVADVVPPGQAKKDVVPPGQAKKDAIEANPTAPKRA